MSSRRITPLLALLAVFALLAGACGDDDAETSSSDNDSQAESDAEDAAEDAIGAQLGGECKFLGQFAGTGFDDAIDPSAALTDGGDAFKALAEQFHEVADAAPSDIEDAFQTLADGFSEFAEAFEGIDFSDPANIDPDAFSAFEDGPGEDFEKASADVEAWIEANCSIGD